MAYDALQFVKCRPLAQLMALQSSFASCAIDGNRLAEVCSDTLSRVITGAPVSDRYIMGLAWAMRDVDKEVADGQH